ncbi:MAG: DivIVA domain-containing protein [Solirubrobacteraceae bacterium]
MPDQSSAASEHAILQEITAPLETLPDDPLALVGADFPTVMRGYDRHAVDDYVEQMTRLVAELHATRSPEAAVRRALERVGDQVSGVLQRAHQTAEQITAQSRAEAEDRLERARHEGASLIEAAERRVRELDADADRVWAERQRIISDAEALSGELLAVARDAADRFPAEETRPAPITDHFADVEQPAPVEGPEPAEHEPEPAAVEEEPEPAAVEEEPEPAAEARPEPEPEMEEDPEPEAAEPSRPVEDPTEPIDPTQRYSLSFDEESTRIIPPASDAAQRRREG